MRILNARAVHFQSYPNLSFEYEKLGLALVSGATGSGKSTLLDLVSWTLYGQTGKEGKSDDIRAWDSTEPTVASVWVEIAGVLLVVNRERGKSNDLYWVENDEIHRGKDLTDTQKLLEIRLGVTSELFLIGSYMTQFSRADSFFIASAKERRKVLEKIADQSFAVTLGEKASEARKQAKKTFDLIQDEINHVSGQLTSLTETLASLENSASQWHVTWLQTVRGLESKLASFEKDTQSALDETLKKSLDWEGKRKDFITASRHRADKIEPVQPKKSFTEALADINAEIKTLKALPAPKCPTCDGSQSRPELESLEDTLNELIRAYQDNENRREQLELIQVEITVYEGMENPHTGLLNQVQLNPYEAQLAHLRLETNPFTNQIQVAKSKLKTLKQKGAELQTQHTAASTRVSRLGWIYDKSFELRGRLMEVAVNRIEINTNGYLQRFFDQILRVHFSLSDSDQLEVEIYNNGHLCPFASLSGGERCMLKLAFTLSLMIAAQDKAGVAFNLLCLDEPLNGLDTQLKEQAFHLLQEIARGYETVLVIEHSEQIKNLFDKRFLVHKQGQFSSIAPDEYENNS